MNVKTRFGTSKQSLLQILRTKRTILFYQTTTFLKLVTMFLLLMKTEVLQSKELSTSVTSINSVNVKFDDTVNLDIKNYSLENGLLKGDSTRYPQINNFVRNVQNTYTRNLMVMY